MACICLSAPLAMATTQLARVTCYSPESIWHWEESTQRKPHMSWVVTTDERGMRTLRMQWASEEKSYE